MPSMLDALNKEVARLQKLSELIAEDPEMEETILKFASEKLASTTNVATNGHRKRSRRVETDDPSQGSTLDRATAFIRQNGPATRQEILKGVGMAEGSFVHFIKNSGKFQQKEDGRWKLA